MSVTLLEKYLPPQSLPYLKDWFGSHRIHIKITRGRSTKLGDYRKMQDGSHQITLNSTLQPHLFFFVLTHELAHLIAFDRFAGRITAHGTEWKKIFGEMLQDSISVYAEDLQPIIFRFSQSPRASFMASPELVRYFHIEDYEDESSYVDDLGLQDRFIYRKKTYIIEQKLKKNYICVELETGKKYIFKPLARVQKIS